METALETAILVLLVRTLLIVLLNWITRVLVSARVAFTLIYNQSSVFSAIPAVKHVMGISLTSACLVKQDLTFRVDSVCRVVQEVLRILMGRVVQVGALLVVKLVQVIQTFA